MNFKNTIFLWAAVGIITTGEAYAQVKKKATPVHRTTTAVKKQVKPAAPRPLLTDPDVITGKLPNGLTYYIRKDTVPKNRAELYLVNKAGSVLETDAQLGMANFIEHLAFKGTRDFSKNDLATFMQNAGMKFGPDKNAYASYDETVYQLSVPTDTLKVFGKAFNVLVNWAAYMKLDPADISSESAELSQEAAAGGKTPQARMQQQTLPVLLNGSRYASRYPIGNANIVKSFSVADVKNFYTDWYRPDMQAIIAVGDFNPVDVLELIKFNFGPLQKPAPEKPLPQFSVPATPGTVVKVATEPNFPYTLVQIVDKHPQSLVKTQADFLESMRINLFNQMLNARISDLSQISSPPFVFGQAGYSTLVGKQDALTALAVAGQTGLESAVKGIAAELERARKFGFTITELENAKQRILGQFTNSFNQKDRTPSSNYTGQYEQNFLTGQAIPGIGYEYNYYLNNIGKVGLSEMNALAVKFITDQNRVILIEAPESEKAKLPNEQTVLKWIEEAGKGVTPYEDYGNEALILHPPAPGSVLSVKVDSTLLITNIMLGNGVKVVLKSTPFQNDQILINGYSFGGTSLAADKDVLSASLAADVISNSGVAGIDQTQLSKILLHKKLNISPYISNTAQGITGYTARSDFETAMQLIQLYFTAPRKDDAVWKTRIAQAKTTLSNAQADPASAYQDTAIAVLGNYNPRAIPATINMLNAADEDVAYNFYKDRFADAGSFTFTFTGAFSVDDIMPFIITYLGSLPSTHANKSYVDHNIHPPTGKITKTIYKGVSDKATVQLIYNGNYDYNEANNVQMDALEGILNTRLSDSLKKESNVYSSGVRVSYVKIPEGTYRVTISFLCDVDKVDKAVAYMINEVDKLKQNGPIQKDVDLFLIKEGRYIQLQLRDNTYWEANLVSALQNGENPDRILYHIQDLNQVTAQSIKEAANKYLGNNLIKLILLPKK